MHHNYLPCHHSGSPPIRPWTPGFGCAHREAAGLNTTTITGEPVDEWAVDLVNEAIAMNLMPARLKGQDLVAHQPAAVCLPGSAAV